MTKFRPRTCATSFFHREASSLSVKLDARSLGLSLPHPSLHQQRQPDVLTVHGRGLWSSRALDQHFARPNLFDVAQNVEHASGANVAERFGALLQSLLT